MKDENDMKLAELLVVIRKNMDPLNYLHREGKLDSAFLVALTIWSALDDYLIRLNELKYGSKHR